MHLRLFQWPDRPIPDTGRANELLLPAQVIASLPDTIAWQWTLSDGSGEFQLGGGPGYRLLTCWYKRNFRVTTAQLLRVLRAGGGVQLIWGTLRAHRPNETDPFLEIDAFDGTWYDIDGPDVLIDGLATQFLWAAIQPAQASPET